MTLKTLHLTNSWHDTSGGIATFYRALIEEANRRGRSIRLVVPAKSDGVENVGDFGRIYHVAAPPARLNSSYRMIYPTQFLAAGSKLQRILAHELPDLVEVCDKYTLNYLGALLRARLLPLDFRPVVVGLSCERMDDNFRTYLGGVPFARQFCSAYMRWLYFPFFDHHIANSDYTADELRTAAQGHLVPRATWVRHMGVDLSHLSPQRRSDSVRRRLLPDFGAFEESVLLLYVGRLVPEKNLSLLFELLERLSQDARDFRLLVVGEGIERQHWELECGERMPGRALFLGHIKDRSMLADIYANADAFIHPNPHEPFGIAPLEAMASGLPLIAPNQGGVTSYANLQNAWTVEATVESFAEAVKEATENEALRTEKTARALATAQEYRWERVAASFLDLYAELHRAFRTKSEALPVSAFGSTPAKGLQAALMRGVSQTAERTFRFVSALASRAKARPPFTGTNSVGQAES